MSICSTVGPVYGFGLETVAAAEGDDAGTVGKESESKGAAEEAGGSGKDGGLTFEGEERGELEVGGGDGHRELYVLSSKL
jgi:hypothetical protein